MVENSAKEALLNTEAGEGGASSSNKKNKLKDKQK